MSPDRRKLNRVRRLAARLLRYSDPITCDNHCGKCTKCMTALQVREGMRKALEETAP